MIVSNRASTSLEAQRLIFGGASALQENTFMYLPYTIIRSSGIDCKRLNCCENPSCTGCVAPHLVAFYKQCLQMNLLYKASPTIAKNRTKANLSVSKFTHRQREGPSLNILGLIDMFTETENLLAQHRHQSKTPTRALKSIHLKVASLRSSFANYTRYSEKMTCTKENATPVVHFVRLVTRKW